jgi:hypothetical protein
MNRRFFARALVAVALATTATPALADGGVDQQVCTATAGCVHLAADPSGAAGADADVSVCPEATTVTLCTGGSAGLGTDRVLHGGGAPDANHPFTAGCTWGGMPGSRVDYGGTATAVARVATVTSVSIRCALYVNSSLFSYTDGVRWNDQSVAHRTVFPPKGAHVLVCMSGASAHWSDGYWVAVATAHCVPDFPA